MTQPNPNMASNPLNTGITIKLDASGNGTAAMGPNVGVRWNIVNVGVRILNAVKIPLCSIYLGGAASPEFFIDGTYTGDFDSTDRTQGCPITAGQRLFAVWTGGDANALATMSITGTYDTQYKSVAPQ